MITHIGNADAIDGFFDMYFHRPLRQNASEDYIKGASRAYETLEIQSFNQEWWERNNAKRR